MTPEQREAMRTKVAQAIGEAFGGACMRQDGACSTDPEFCGCQRATDAALAVAEPVVREDERKMCISDLREMAGYEADETASKAMTGAAFVLELTRDRGAA